MRFSIPKDAQFTRPTRWETAKSELWRAPGLMVVVRRLVVAVVLIAGGMGATHAIWGGTVPPPGGTCFKEAFLTWGSYPDCAKATEAYIAQAVDGVIKRDGWLWPTPIVLYWADNVLVVVYTALFAISLAWSYQSITSRRTVSLVVWRRLFIFSVLVAIAAAIADHAENFWALAKFHDAPFQKEAEGALKPSFTHAELDAIASVSVWKSRWFTLALVLSVAGVVAAVLGRENWVNETRYYKTLNRLAMRRAYFPLKNNNSKQAELAPRFWLAMRCAYFPLKNDNSKQAELALRFWLAMRRAYFPLKNDNPKQAELALRFWRGFPRKRRNYKIPQQERRRLNVPPFLHQASVFLFFVNAQVPGTRGCRRFFSRNAVGDYWKACFGVPLAFGAVDDEAVAGMERAMDEYLHFLVRRGYLAPAGSRYEVMFDGSKIFGPATEAPPAAEHA